MHVLVTGAGGFSGAELASALVARGHRITAVVRSTRGRLVGDPSGAADRFAIISGDLSGDMVLPEQVDVVVHAAASSPAPGVTIADFVRDNVLSTERIMDYAVRAGARKFIYFSSLSVHGRIETPLVDEKTPVLDPDAYGMTKRIGEQILQAGSTVLPSLALRLPGVIGRRSVRNWLTRVLAAARNGEDVEVYNPDGPFNNAVHVEDLARFVCGLLDREWTGFDAFPLAAGGQTTVGEAAHVIVGGFGARSRIRIVPSQAQSFAISIDRARKRYGYAPMQIADMLRRFVRENSAP